MGAGTDASVYVTLFGAKGTSPRTKLEASGNHFERAQTDAFTIETPRLGRLSMCRIEHDNKGIAPGWLLERIVVTHVGTEHRYIFPCHEWLSKKHGLIK